MATSMNLREELPVDIVQWASLESTINDLFANFEAWEQRNAELINKFFNQNYFTWDESLINKLIDNQPHLQFDDIKDERINLAILRDNRELLWDFKDCMDKITVDEIKTAFITEIHNQVEAIIWPITPWTLYGDFNNPDKCGFPWNTNVVAYFERVVNYLQEKENATWGKKSFKVLKNVNITNENLNIRLAWTGHEIPAWMDLSDPAIPINTKNSFDKLLAFEIGKEASRTIEIAKDFSKNLEWLHTNTFPAINTIVWESEEYKYDETRLWPDYQTRLQAIKDDTTLSEYEKEKQIQNLKRELYIRYVKTKNAKIWNALEQLYNNDFDYSKIDRTILKNYLDTVADIRFKKLFDKWINEYIKLNYGNLDDFKKFYKDLADVDPANPTLDITLGNVKIPWVTPTTLWDRTLHIQRKLVEWKNEWLKNLDEFWKNASKSFDTLPIEYTINKSDIDTLDIAIEDKTKLMNLLSKFEDWDKYTIKWENIWNLIYLYFIINSITPIVELDPAKQKEIENVFWKVKKSNTETKESPVYSPAKFKKEIEKYGSGTKFENWSELWLPMWSSDLPWWWYQWMKIKISDIDMNKWTFKWKISWWELKFKSNLEWKTNTFDMNENFIQSLWKISKDSKKIWLMPNPNNSDFNTFKNGLNGKLWTSDLSFPPSWVDRTGNKFTKKIVNNDWKEEDVEIKHFWVKSDDKISYKVEYNPIRKTFTVSSIFNWEEKWKNWKSETKHFSYKRDMDWNNFLIFFTQKWLQPQTDEEAQNAANKQEQQLKMVNSGYWKLNWFSFNNIKTWFKDVIWAIKKKMDEYDKSQTDKFKGIIESPLLDVISKFPLPDSMKYAISERQQEIYNERDNAVWKKIEWYLKVFQADPDFWTTFDQIPPHAKTQWWKSLQMIVKQRVENATDRMWDPWLYQAAALLLANFEKWGSPYRGLSAQENSWLWVKALLWKAHYEQFMRDKAKLSKARDDAEAWWSGDKKWLNETLAVCEWKYIINNIRWSYKWLITWSYEERWIPWEDGTNYIDNPAKRLLSDQFAKKLEDAYQWRFTKNSVKGKYDKFALNNSFDEMENEFGKAGSSRYQIWEAALRRMIDLASNDSLKKRVKKHFLTYLLSGALDVNCDPGVKKQVYGRAKPMMFVPWLLVKEAGVAENIAILLDNATDNDFSKHVKKYFHRKDQLNWQIDFKWLQKEINVWLTDETMAKLEKYFSDLPTKDFSNEPEPQRSVLEKYKKAMSDSNRDEADWWILDNAKVVSNWLLSSVEVVQKRLNIKNWAFNGKDIDENNNMEDFWKNVTKDINSRSTEPRQVAFVLDKFLNWFGIDNQQVYERILTADHYRKYPWYCIVPYKGVELNMWNIWRKEIDSILWYAFQWNAWRSRWLWCDKLPPELFETLESFRIYFSKAFYNGDLLDSYVINKGFQPKFKDAKTLLMGSRAVYDQSFTWDSELSLVDTSEDDLFSSDDNKKRKAEKNKKKELLKSSVFINSDIANIDKQLIRNLWWTSGQFTPITSSISRNLRDEYLDRLAA